MRYEASLRSLCAAINDELSVFPWPETPQGREALQWSIERGSQAETGADDWRMMCSVDYDRLGEALR